MNNSGFSLPPRHVRQGGVLLLVLFAVALLTSIVLSSATLVRLRWALATDTLRREEARDAAITAIAAALHHLTADTNKVDHPGEPWNDPSETGGILLADEESRIDLRTATPEVIAALFVQATDLTERRAEVLAQSLIRWRDALASPPDALERLRAIPGLTHAILERIAPHATVHGHGRVNLNTATEPVFRILLTSVGTPREAYGRILAGFRTTRRNSLILENKNATGIATLLLGPSVIPNPAEAKAITALLPLLDVGSSAFRGSCLGLPPSGNTPNHRIEFVYDRSSRTFLRWVE